MVGVVKDTTDRIIDAIDRLNKIEDLHIPQGQLKNFNNAKTSYNNFIDEYQSFREEINQKFIKKDLIEIYQVNSINIEKIPDLQT